MQFPIYARSAQAKAINPTRWPFIRAMCQATFRLGAMTGARVPLAIPYKDMLKAAKQLPNTTAGNRTRAHIYFCWFACLRPTDALQVRPKNVRLLPDGSLTILVQYSKTIRSIGSYWSHSVVVDPEAREFLLQWIPQQKGAFMFPTTSAAHHRMQTKDLLDALRKVNKHYESRGLRRGVLQHARNLGASDEALLSMSRHTNIKMLQLYLSDVPMAADSEAVAVFARMNDTDLDKDLQEANRDMQKMAGAGAWVELPGMEWIKVSPNGSIMAVLERMPKAQKKCRTREEEECWPLHVKLMAHQRVNLDRVSELAEGNDVSPEVKEHWKRTISYLQDSEGLFGAVPFSGYLERARFSKEDIKLLMERGNVARLTKEDMKRIRGTAHVFWIGEERLDDLGNEANRRRVITETRDFNRFWSKFEVLWNVHSTPRKVARLQILNGPACLTLDASAQFDQMMVGDAVSFAQVFQHGRHVYRRTTASMGCRPSSDAGTSLTEVMVAFPTKCEVAIATDAVRFIGSFEDVLEAGWTLVQRAAYVNLTFNGINCHNATKADVKKLITTVESEFLGERVNLVKKTVCCKTKHVTRLTEAVSIAWQPQASYRDFLMLFGIMNFMSEVLAVRKDRYFNARTFYSEIAREVAMNPELLDQPARKVIPAHLRDWVGVLAANVPVKVEREKPCEAGIVFDASAHGAAGIIVLPNGKEELLQHRWTKAERSEMNLRFSSVSESAAARLLIRQASARWPELSFMMLSDHDGLVKAFKHKNLCCRAYNEAITTVLDCGSHNQLRYVPGSENPADAYSRMERFTLLSKDGYKARTLWQLAMAEQAAGKGSVSDDRILVSPDRGDDGDTDPAL
jgi:hypothetical protein